MDSQLWPYPHLNLAIEKHSASFDQVAETYFYGLEEFNSNEDNRSAYSRYYPKVVEAFETAHGAINHLLMCSTCIGAVVLTDRYEYFMTLNPQARAEFLESQSL